MKKPTTKTTSAIAILVALLLLSAPTAPAYAMTATGVIEKGEDFVHFDLTIMINFTITAFNITKHEFAGKREEWMARWEAWKGEWEHRYTEWMGKWKEWMGMWGDWDAGLKSEWRNRWRSEWGGEWNPEWGEKWEKWEEWIGNWSAKWRAAKFEEWEEIPPFVRPDFMERMRGKFENLWHKHVNASALAHCWATPASQLGLKRALGHSVNKTLQWIYNKTDVYVKNFDLIIELTTNTVYINDIRLTTGLFNLTLSFDLYGIVTANASGLFIRSRFRYLNVTEKVDGGEFGYHGWMFTPGKAMFLDLSVFNVPLEEWTITPDPTADTTTFTLIRDINVTTPFGNVIIDPEMSLTVPGYASGVGDTISTKLILPGDLLPLKATVTAAIVVTIAFTLYSLRRRMTTAPIPTPRL